MRRLLALFSRPTKPKDFIEQQSPLLNLPLDIVHAIIDELPLPAMILFSQTCRDLRLLIQSKCYSTVRQASAAKRLDFLCALGHILPDHRLCAHCRALHLVDLKDLPVTAYDTFYKPCTAPEPLFSRHRLLPYYAVAQRHVQLAIKYTRLAGTHQSYRASILQRFTISYPEFYSLGLDFTAEPIVVHGRFILKTTWDFREAAAPVSFAMISHASFGLCAHLRAATRFAFEVADVQSGFHQEAHSCDRCPTDCSIVVQGSRAIFHVWQDLGSGLSPMDPYWLSHINDVINDVENNEFSGTKFCYKHGSVRDLYYGSGTPPQVSQSIRCRTRKLNIISVLWLLSRGQRPLQYR